MASLRGLPAFSGFPLKSTLMTNAQQSPGSGPMPFGLGPLPSGLYPMATGYMNTRNPNYIAGTNNMGSSTFNPKYNLESGSGTATSSIRFAHSSSALSSSASTSVSYAATPSFLTSSVACALANGPPTFHTRSGQEGLTPSLTGVSAQQSTEYTTSRLGSQSNQPFMNYIRHCTRASPVTVSYTLNITVTDTNNNKCTFAVPLQNSLTIFRLIQKYFQLTMNMSDLRTNVSHASFIHFP